jgi:hypothetical protein
MPSQDPKAKGKKFNKKIDDKIKETLRSLQDEMKELCKVDITCSILGIRNLISKASEPHVTLKITNSN